MASSSSHIKRYHVFLSFHGRDVRIKFLSHLQNHFASKDELVEIFKCKEDQDQVVMTVFYGVNPSDVRKQIGDFGLSFKKTCEKKTEEVKLRWSQALTDVANIEGEHSLNWANEADMIQKIATDVSKKLNVTLSRDFDDMVGLQVHLRKVNSLLCLDCDDVKMIGIWGPAGIGKTTIARALFNQLDSEFGLKCFMGNLRGGSCRSNMGVDDYDSKLCLQNQLLSKILNQKDMRIHNLGAIKEWLQNQRVLIILDDVDDVEQLETLAKEPSWFGPGSRIIITTKDQKVLKAHRITHIYHVDFPSGKEALEMLCLSAFKQSSVPYGFEELANKVAKLCGYLPLGLSVVGKSLREDSKHEWELQLSRLVSSLDRKIEDVLRVGYDRLSRKDQAVFLHIACIFNNKNVDDVTSMLAHSNLDVENGLKNLAVKSLVQIENWGMHNGTIVVPFQKIVMHSLLEQMGRQIVHEQKDEPGKRQFLVEAGEVCDVLAKETGTGSIIGISFDTSNMSDFFISGRAFEGIRNLQFLRFSVHNWNFFRKDVPLRISGDMEYLPPPKLLHWDLYPRTRLSPTFQPECLIELSMRHSNLQKLWGGIKPLPNLKTINLGFCKKLKEIPNLSEAINLETLSLEGCISLVELPSSIRNLHKLEKLSMWGCEYLRVIPTSINLASLKRVDMRSCSRLRTLPYISSNINHLDVRDTKIKDVPASVAGRWSLYVA
ncbi:unnamed protein product [Microthlaspi erraticum]|uniref:TIR domain-containing protein n=1 Tax=Microthlaspi erraticum TaxID=1685480 RepID=A0A6D2JPN5_9BRAS|nr:unnamed protein product [Microthlaspi erraticum]